MSMLELDSLASILKALDIHSLPQLTLVEATMLADQYLPPFSPGVPVLIASLDTPELSQAVQKVLLQQYPSAHPIRIAWVDGAEEVIVNQLLLADLGQHPLEGAAAALYLPAIGESYSFESFQNIIARLRAPGGCPWDQKQTHQSMRSDLLEEAYEVLAALDANDPAAMREEFGDLLLHIVMQAQIGTENGEFTMPDVVRGIHTKIVRRHPHVFGEKEVAGDQEILANWEEMKAQERFDLGQSEAGLLDSLNLALPALVQAQQFQARAARVKFDWPDISGVLEKVYEEIEEVRQAESADERHAEIGDLLFAVVNLARWYKVDAESALRQGNQRFRQRFKYIEQSARSQGKQVSDFTLDEMDRLWEEAKRK